MKNLELKHIAPYLPYGLKGIFTIYNTEQNVHSLSKRYVNRELEYRHFKPLLLPINTLIDSEFKKEFEEKFDYIGFDFEHYSSLIDCVSDSNILSFPYELVLWLIEKHFDVFGLIEQGLAIDINTLAQ